MARIVGQEPRDERRFELAMTDSDFAAMHDICRGFRIYCDENEMDMPPNVLNFISFLEALEEDTRA